MAARYSEVRRLMRFTPVAARAATVNDLPLIPTMKLKGLPTAAQTARTASRSGRPGAISASAPAALIRFQPLDRVLQIEPPAQEIFGPSRQRERKRQRPRRRGSGRDPLRRMGGFKDWRGRV